MSKNSKKIIDELSDRLDTFQAKYNSSNTNNNEEEDPALNDGINYWRGKKIISFMEWAEIGNIAKAFQYGVKHQRTWDALQYFPDDYSHTAIFPFGVKMPGATKEENDKLLRAVDKWYKQYIELMKFRKNTKYILKTTLPDKKYYDELYDYDPEWLETLRENGINSNGLKIDPDMKRRAELLHKEYCEKHGGHPPLLEHRHREENDDEE